jgi:hypothetical protein
MALETTYFIKYVDDNPDWEKEEQYILEVVEG